MDTRNFQHQATEPPPLSQQLTPPVPCSLACPRCWWCRCCSYRHRRAPARHGGRHRRYLSVRRRDCHAREVCSCGLRFITQNSPSSPDKTKLVSTRGGGLVLSPSPICSTTHCLCPSKRVCLGRFPTSQDVHGGVDGVQRRQQRRNRPLLLRRLRRGNTTSSTNPPRSYWTRLS